jgi:hypothetical protein
MTYNDHVIITPIPGDPTTINASGRLSFTIYPMAYSIVDIAKYGMNLAMCLTRKTSFIGYRYFI